MMPNQSKRFINQPSGQTGATSNPTETGIGETEEVSGHSSAGSPQMLPRQAVAGTPTPKKIGRQALSSAGKKGALRAKEKSSATDKKTTEDDILRL